ncbi:unnamed protein product [Taenia asiatica]|uniref:Uncharacterized protein n=1 Tax=Taenia asiatica TaxID=60517 RepID=A0A0R3W9R0_TAEAS|nr:unnamed protein product [Taenia asiatica]
MAFTVRAGNGIAAAGVIIALRCLDGERLRVPSPYSPMRIRSFDPRYQGFSRDLVDACFFLFGALLAIATVGPIVAKGSSGNVDLSKNFVMLYRLGGSILLVCSVLNPILCALLCDVARDLSSLQQEGEE